MFDKDKDTVAHLLTNSRPDMLSAFLLTAFCLLGQLNPPLNQPRLAVQLFRQGDGPSLGIAAPQYLCLLHLLGQVNFFNLLVRRAVQQLGRRSYFLNLFLLGGHYSLESCITNLTDS